MNFYHLIVITSKYNGKTIYNFWKNIEIADRIIIRYVLKNCGDYKPTLKIMNLRTREVFYASPAELLAKLDKLSYEESKITDIDIFNFEQDRI